MFKALIAVVAQMADNFSKFTAAQKGVLTFAALLFGGVVCKTWSLLAFYVASVLATLSVISYLSNQRIHFNTSFLPGFMKKLKLNLNQFLVSVLKIQTDIFLPPRINPKKYSLVLEEEISKLLKYIERDFVHSWYFHVIEGSASWAWYNHKLFEVLISKVQKRLSNVNRESAVRSFVRTFTKFMADFQDAQLSLKQQPHYVRKKSQENEFKKLTTIEQSFDSLGKFHVALENAESEIEYLRSLMELALEIVLPEQLMECEGGRIILQEILTQNILCKLLNMMSETEWLHQIMIKILSDEELLLVDKVKQKSDQRTHDTVDSNHHTVSGTQPQLTNADIRQTERAFIVQKSQDDGDTVFQGEGGPENAKQLLPKIDEPDDSKSSIHLSNTTKCLEKQNKVTPRQQAATPELTRTMQLPVTVHEGTSVIQIYRQSSLAIMCESSPSLLTAQNLKRSSSVNVLSSPADSVTTNSRSTVSGSSSYASLQMAQSHSKRRPSEPGTMQTLALPHQNDENFDRFSLCSSREDQFPASDVESHLDCMSESEVAEESVSPQLISTTADEAVPTEACHLDDEDITVGCDVVAELSTDPEFIFEMIVVPEYEVAKEAGGGGFYTLYTIQYDAWHQDAAGGWELQTTVLRRRFREFLTLNERLQEHTLYKKLMKNVKGPHRMLHMPLGVKDKNMIEKRRQFLEKYMKVLIRKEGICHSIPLKEFLAYEEDASIAFVKKASDVSRIDKVIVKTMTGIVDKIGRVFPSLPDDNQLAKKSAKSQEKSHKKRRRKTTSSQEDIREDPDDIHVILNDSHLDEVDAIECHMDSYILDAADIISDDVKTDAEEFHDPLDFCLFSSVPRSSGDGCEMSEGDVSEACRDVNVGISMTTSLLDLAVQSAHRRQCWVCQEEVLNVFKILFGKAFESFIQDEVADLTTEQRWAFYVNQLCEAIWPDGHLDEEEVLPSSDQQKQATRAQARHCLQQFFPDIVPIVVGQEDFQYCVDMIMDSIDHSKLNRHFLLCVLDTFMEFTIPEISTAELHRKLLKRYMQQ